MTDDSAAPSSYDAVDLVGAADSQTGHPVVDEVLASLPALDERPMAEHVEVFTSAHDRLRGLLADPTP